MKFGLFGSVEGFRPAPTWNFVARSVSFRSPRQRWTSSGRRWRSPRTRTETGWHRIWKCCGRERKWNRPPPRSRRSSRRAGNTSTSSRRCLGLGADRAELRNWSNRSRYPRFRRSWRLAFHRICCAVGRTSRPPSDNWRRQPPAWAWRPRSCFLRWCSAAPAAWPAGSPASCSTATPNYYVGRSLRQLDGLRRRASQSGRQAQRSAGRCRQGNLPGHRPPRVPRSGELTGRRRSCAGASE